MTARFNSLRFLDFAAIKSVLTFLLLVLSLDAINQSNVSTKIDQVLTREQTYSNSLSLHS